MRFSLSKAVAAVLLTLVNVSAAQDMIESSSLTNCQGDSGFSASLFDVVYTPANNSLSVSVNGISTIAGNVTADITVLAYGYQVIQQSVNPCDTNLDGLCPMTSGPFNILSNIHISPSVASEVPSIAYTIPDLDGKVQVIIRSVDTNASLACVEADLSNGKTVYQKGVGWATAVVAGLALLTSAIVSGLGHSNTAAHVAANTLSLFGYFQSQALFGMTAVPLPPIVQSWTQNFQWSMGIIDVGFIEAIATWYQRSTGGTPSTTIVTLATTSVQVQKRSLATRASDWLARRTNHTNNAETLKTIVLMGIKRVGFRAGIETTNIFLTGYIFLIIFFVFIVLGVVAFKWILEGLAKAGKIKGDKFQEFRNGWLIVLKGILFRIVIISFPQMSILCLWEFVERDSPGEVALALVTLATMLVTLTFACIRVWRLARRSIDMHKNPAYILYSDPVSLNKWGFLYVQFKATAYWFTVPLLVFILIEGMFVGLGQGNGTAQAVGLLILMAGFLVALSILRPYMDKKTNAFNISIAAVNFVSAVFLLFFTDVFGLPGLVVGIMGVVFFIMNAAFALILLLMVIVASVYAVVSKNPDNRYQPMRDDRSSFIKSQTNLTTELDALGVTARGESKHPFGVPRDRDDDEESYSSGSIDRAKAALNRTSYHGASQQNLYPGGSPHPPSSPYRDSPANGGFFPSAAPAYSPYNRTPTSERADSSLSDMARQRSANNASPWQRGAGYEK